MVVHTSNQHFWGEGRSVKKWQEYPKTPSKFENTVNKQQKQLGTGEMALW